METQCWLNKNIDSLYFRNIYINLHVNHIIKDKVVYFNVYICCIYHILYSDGNKKHNIYVYKSILYFFMLDIYILGTLVCKNNATKMYSAFRFVVTHCTRSVLRCRSFSTFERNLYEPPLLNIFTAKYLFFTASHIGAFSMLVNALTSAPLPSRYLIMSL